MTEGTGAAGFGMLPGFLSGLFISVVFFLLLYAVAAGMGRIPYRNSRKKRKLERTLYMLEVQQILYSTYENTNQIKEALRKVAVMLTGKRAFLVSTEAGELKDFYFCENNGEEEEREEIPLTVFLPHTFARLAAGEPVLIYRGSGRVSVKDREILEAAGFASLMMVPVLDQERHLKGILGVLDMEARWKDCILLECVARNFLMALRSAASYHVIREMGSRDALTGLRNRNFFQLQLEAYEKETLLQVIYLDANGLHSMNNILGHAAGDAMLAFVGSRLKEVFGEENAYRIGGDEFIVMLSGGEWEAEKKLKALQKQFEGKEYCVSVGMAVKSADMSVKDAIAEAEYRMYENKTAYYREKGDESRARSMNYKLEQILLEKKDADHFLEIISSYFMGVYIVNLDTDEVRVIYKPAYFAAMLDASEGRFSVALGTYRDTFLDASDWDKFREVLDFCRVEQALCTRENLKYHYRKQDGTEVALRIRRSPEYTEDKKETFWLFEEYMEHKNS